MSMNDSDWDDDGERYREEASLYDLTSHYYPSPLLMKPIRAAVGEDILLKITESDYGSVFCKIVLKDTSDLRSPWDAEVASWYMSPFPGLCAAVILNGGSVAGRWREKGVGRALMALKKRLAYDAGYSIVVASDVCDPRSPQGKIFKRHGFERVFEGVNDRTQNLCGIYATFIGDNP